MKIKSISIKVATQPRGNRHGYTTSDYARDAAIEIERSLAAMGRSSWPADSNHAALEECAAINEARTQIAQCDEMFRDLLSVAIDEVEIDE